MRKTWVLLTLVIAVVAFIGCGEDEEVTSPDDETTTITIDDVVGTYDLVSFYDQSEDFNLVIGSAEAGDLEHTRAINADGTYSVTETESGEAYTESGAFVLDGEANAITFEIKECSDEESIGVKNKYAVAISANQLILSLRDSTDPLFKEDIGDKLTYRAQ